MNATRQLHIRLSETLDEAIKKTASSQGLRVSEWIKYTLAKAAHYDAATSKPSKPKTTVDPKPVWLTLNDVLSGVCRRPDGLHYDGSPAGPKSDRMLAENDAAIEKLIRAKKFTSEMAAKALAYRNAHLIEGAIPSQVSPTDVASVLSDPPCPEGVDPETWAKLMEARKF